MNALQRKPRRNLTVVLAAKGAKTGPMARPLRLITGSDDREFLSAALEILETPASPRRIAFIWLVCLIFAGALIWSCFAKLDIYAVASGRIQPSGRSKVVQSLDPGKIKLVSVANGMRVNAGDTLLQLDPTEAEADRRSAASELEAADAEVARRQAAIDAVRSGAGAPGLATATTIRFPENVASAARQREQVVLAADLAQYAASLAGLQGQLGQNLATKEKLSASIAQRSRLLGVLQQRVEMRHQLVQLQVGSVAARLDAQQQLESELTNVASEKGQLLEAEAAALTTRYRIEQLMHQFVADQANKLSDTLNRRDRLKENVIKADAKADRMQLVSPISGTVQQLSVTTIGQVISVGQPLLVIVPHTGPIEIEALVQNRDFGFVAVGQEAVVKIDAFPFTRYGTVAGEIVRISHDAVFDKDLTRMDAAMPQSQTSSTLDATPKTQGLVYPVAVQLERSSMLVDGKETPLMPGMTATVEIRTGERRVIDYLLSPLREVASQAGHER